MREKQAWLKARKRHKQIIVWFKKILSGSAIAALIVGPLIYFGVAAQQTAQILEGDLRNKALREAAATPEVRTSNKPIEFPNKVAVKPVKYEDLNLEIQETKLPEKFKKTEKVEQTSSYESPDQEKTKFAAEFKTKKEDFKIKNIESTFDGLKEKNAIYKNVSIDYGPAEIKSQDDANSVARNTLQKYLNTIDGGNQFAVLKDTTKIEQIKQPDALVIYSIKNNNGKWYVDFKQYHNLLPVFDGNIKMIFTERKKLLVLTDNLRRNLPAESDFKVGTAVANESTKGLFEWDETKDQIQFINKGYYKEKPAYKVETNAHNPLGKWDVYVNGVDGTVEGLMSDIRTQDAPLPVEEPAPVETTPVSEPITIEEPAPTAETPPPAEPTPAEGILPTEETIPAEEILPAEEVTPTEEIIPVEEVVSTETPTEIVPTEVIPTEIIPEEILPTEEPATPEAEIEILQTLLSQVLGKIYPKTPNDPQEIVPFANEYVYIANQTNTTTDTEGYFDNINQDWYSIFLEGPYVTVSDNDATANANIINESPADPFIWDENSASLAAINAFYHTNKIHDWFASTMAYQMNTPIPLAVNSQLADEYLYGCGSWFNNSLKTIEIGRGGYEGEINGVRSPCMSDLNYALSSDVIYHEYAHYIIEDVTHLPNITGSESASMGEGLTDYFASTINNDSVWGDVISVRTRDLQNTLKYKYYDDLGTELSDMTGESHYDGQIFAGALWDLRKEIGAEFTDKLVFNTLFQGRIHFETFMYGMIIEDDDDNDFSNGTPHLIQILQAFENHGIGPGVVNFTGLPISPEDWTAMLQEAGYEGEENPLIGAGTWSGTCTWSGTVDVSALSVLNGNTCVLSAGTTTPTTVTVNQGGTLSVSGGSLAASSYILIDGTLNATTSAATITSSSYIRTNSTGIANFRYGSVTATNYLGYGQLNIGPTSFPTSGASVTFNSASTASTIYSGGTLQIYGYSSANPTLNVSGNTLTINQGATATVDQYGNLRAKTLALTGSSAGDALLTLDGTLNAASTTNVVNLLAYNATNQGNIEVSSTGTLYTATLTMGQSGSGYGGVLTNSGTVTLTAGYNATMWRNSLITNNNNFTVQNSYYLYIYDTSTFTNNGTFNTGNLNIGAATTAGGTFTNNGTSTISQGTIYGYASSASTYTNAATKTSTINTLYLYTGATLDNNGILTGTGNLMIGSGSVNGGTLNNNKYVSYGVCYVYTGGVFNNNDVALDDATATFSSFQLGATGTRGGTFNNYANSYIAISGQTYLYSPGIFNNYGYFIANGGLGLGLQNSYAGATFNNDNTVRIVGNTDLHYGGVFNNNPEGALSTNTLTVGYSSATAVSFAQDETTSGNYISAYLKGGTSATTTPATWAAVTNGSFRITINSTQRDITGINFTGVTTMQEVASKIQAAIRAVTGSTETCMWLANHFEITSANTTTSSAVTVTSAVGSGTDISGAGATAFMDSDVGAADEAVVAYTDFRTTAAGNLVVNITGTVNSYDKIKVVGQLQTAGGAGGNGTFNGLCGTTKASVITAGSASLQGILTIAYCSSYSGTENLTIPLLTTIQAVSSSAGKVEINGKATLGTTSNNVRVQSGGRFFSGDNSNITFNGTPGITLSGGNLTGKADDPFVELAGNVSTPYINMTGSLYAGYMCIGNYDQTVYSDATVGNCNNVSGNTVTLTSAGTTNLYIYPDTGTGTETTAKAYIANNVTMNSYTGTANVMEINGPSSTKIADVTQVAGSTITINQNAAHYLTIQGPNATFNSNGAINIPYGRLDVLNGARTYLNNTTTGTFGYAYQFGSILMTNNATANPSLLSSLIQIGSATLSPTVNISDSHTCSTGGGICAIEINHNTTNTNMAAHSYVDSYGSINIGSSIGSRKIYLGKYQTSTVAGNGYLRLLKGTSAVGSLTNSSASGDLILDRNGSIYVDDTATATITGLTTLTGTLSNGASFNVYGHYTTGTPLTIPTGTSAHIGSTGHVIVSGSATNVTGTYYIDGQLDSGDLTVYSGGLITSSVGTSTNMYINATKVDVQSGGKISSDGVSNGYRDSSLTRDVGGSYGGLGYNYTYGTYGNVKGGATGGYYPEYGEAGIANEDTTSNGGGGVYIRSTGDIIIAGIVSANGAVENKESQATGSGGTVIIKQDISHSNTSAVFTDGASHTGYIQANGGDSSGTGTAVGGGGRIIIESILLDDPDNGTGTEYNFAASHIQAKGGVNSTSSYYAGAGTIVYLGDTNNPSGTLIVDQITNSSGLGTQIPDPQLQSPAGSERDWTFDRIEAKNYANISFDGSTNTPPAPTACFETGSNSNVDETYFTCAGNPDKPYTLYINNSGTGAQSGTEPSGASPTSITYDLTPVFSIKYAQPETGAPTINKVVVQVDDDADFTDDTVLWEGTKTLTSSVSAGNRSVDFEYSGPTLSTGTTYYVRAAFRNNGDTATGLWNHRDMGSQYKFQIASGYLSIDPACTDDTFSIKDNNNPTKNIRTTSGKRFGKGTCTIAVNTSTIDAWQIQFGLASTEASEAAAFADVSANNIDPINNTSTCDMTTGGTENLEKYAFNISNPNSIGIVQTDTEGTCNTYTFANTSKYHNIELNSAKDTIMTDNDAAVDSSFDLNVYANVSDSTVVSSTYTLDMGLLLTTLP